MLFKNNFFKCSLAFLMVFFIENGNAQTKEPLSLIDKNVEQNNIVMTWNKNTPESEMKDDIKALADKGVTIKYSSLKRNSKDEITAIKVEFSDRKGNSGKLEYNNSKPINTIKFYQSNDEIGFGEPSNSNDMLANNDIFRMMPNAQNIMKEFQYRFNDNSISPDGLGSDNSGKELFGRTKSKMMIKQDGKKPLVIEDGKVIEGGDDYTPEELDKIKSENKIELNSNGNDGQLFDSRSKEGLEELQKEMEKVRKDFKNDNSTKSEMEKTTDEMLKAKEEMLKAKEEMENARKELQKAKSTLKTQKI